MEANPTIMIRNYIAVAFRNLLKTKNGSPELSSIINLTGLAVSFAAFFLIGTYVIYQFSFDSFIPEHQTKYRLVAEQKEGLVTTAHSAKTYPGLRQLLTDEIPEISSVARVLAEECLFHDKETDRKFSRQFTYWADGNFPEFLGLQFLLKGNTNLMYEPNQMVISASGAERFFGTDWQQNPDIIGKTMYLNESIPFTIQGVYEDLPQTSHLAVDFIVSYQTLVVLVGSGIDEGMPPYWKAVYSYIETNSSADSKALTQKINSVIASRLSEEQMNGATIDFQLQPVTSIHLESGLTDELQPNGNKTFVLILLMAGVLILIVAWINFINLTTAHSLDRAREIGVRKSLGAQRGELIIQFITETLFSGFVALLISLVIIILGFESFKALTGIHYELISQPSLMVGGALLCTVILGAIISSIYPALLLSNFKPVLVLKGRHYSSPKSGYFRQSLIVFQFATAIILLCATTAVFLQVDFMRNQYLGMNPDQVLVLHSPRSLIGNNARTSVFEEFRLALKNHSDVIDVGSGGAIPGDEFLYHSEGIHVVGNDVGQLTSFDIASVDDGFIPSLEIPLIAGRNFVHDTTEVDKVIINETAVNVLGFESVDRAINTEINSPAGVVRIVGVIEDVHFLELEKGISPLLLRYGHDYEFGYFTVKLASSNIEETLPNIRNLWNTLYPNDPFDYFFLDTFFDAQYENDRAFGRLFSVFTGLAIFVAILGLFGLVSFATFQRSKEIGIRKVLGATIPDILELLNRNFFILIVIASAIAVPLSTWLVNQWLQNFEYRVLLSWWVYMVPVVIIIFCALIAVSWQSLKAATSNPVDAIKEG